MLILLLQQNILSDILQKTIARRALIDGEVANFPKGLRSTHNPGSLVILGEPKKCSDEFNRIDARFSLKTMTLRKGFRAFPLPRTIHDNLVDLLGGR
jgi:hypothetical protein